MIELDSRYVETLTMNAQKDRHFEGAKPLCIDIKDYCPPDNLAIDFIIGGPPCQTFSAAGRRASGVSGLDDPRGQLFQEYARILHQLQPKGFLFENVYGITGAQGGKAWREILQTFAAEGYTISSRLLDAADYGVPQHRERLIVVGLRDQHFAFPRPTHGPDSSDLRPYYTAGLAIQGAGGEKSEPIGGRYGHLLNDIPPGLNYSFYTEEMGHPHPHFAWRSKFSDLLYKADPDMPIRTLKAQGGQYTGPFHWENRPFSINELKRLQTFPDDYLLAGGRLAAIEQISNSVPPQFGRMLALAVLDQAFDISLPFTLGYLAPQEELSFRQRKTQLTRLYREKAAKAIASLYPSVRPEESSKSLLDDGVSVRDKDCKNLMTHSAYLGADFAWYVKGDSDQVHPWNVKLSITESEQYLEFQIASIASTMTHSSIIVDVFPTNSWNIPVEVVRLIVQEPSLFLLTAAWKAFDYYIAKKNIKADLVQLNGYYQYTPRICIKPRELEYTEATEPPYQWQTVKHVLEGIGVRQTMALEKLAALWHLALDDTIDSLIMLRALGYEVRSHYTNNQIPDGHVLIPYAFPTFTPKSVQMRKTLFPEHFLKQERSQVRQVLNARELWQVGG